MTTNSLVPIFRSTSLWLAVSALSIACFSPEYPTDLACGPDDFCPPGQTCSADNICEAEIAPGQPDAQQSPDADRGLGALESIEIGADVTISLAETHVFVVTGMYEGGTQTENNALIIWRSSDMATAFVDFTGEVQPQSTGVVTITADLNGRVDTMQLTVTP